MEYEITNKEFKSTKRTLTAIVVVSVFICVASAIVRGILSSQIQDFSNPLLSLLAVTTILGLFVSLLALNTRLQVEFDDAELAQQAVFENEQK
jgi:hypothetical protein